MSLRKTISVILIFLLAILTLGLSVEAASEAYYVVGSFNSYKMDEKSKMTINPDGSYSYLLDNTSNNIQLSITDGENYYRTGGLNKGSSFLIKEKGLYDITLDINKENNNVAIVKRPEPSYYVLGSQGYEINDSLKMTYIDRGKYEYILDCKADTLIYISDGSKEYRDINGDDYYIKDEGKYKLSFTITKANHLLKITPVASIDYYFISSLNGYEIDQSYKMSLENDEYIYDIATTGYVGFYIGNEAESYKNGMVEYILDGMKSYRIHFKPTSKEIKIEEVDYYILNEANGFKIDSAYRLEINSDNKSFLEYSYLVDIKSPYQFIIASKYNSIDDNGSSFIIDKDGKYEILFSPEHLYQNNKSVSYKASKRPSNKYYLVGSFNDYEINEDYLLEYNLENQDYNEFTIDITLNKGDSFYIKNNDNSYYAPNGSELKAPYNGHFRIYFSKDYDYGNGYNIAYKLINDEENEPRSIIIENKEQLLSFIDECNMDSYSNNLTVELRADINMEGMEIKPIGIFSGRLNGNFHKIHNFKLDTSLALAELGFINILLNTGEVNNLILDYSLEAMDCQALGGIVGRSYGAIRNCSYNGRLKGNRMTGGIVGRNEEGSKILGSSASGEIISKAFTGGISGFNAGEISECVNKARINDTIFSSKDEAMVSNIGGICGYNSGSIAKSTNSGIAGIKRLGIFIGGISGSSIGSISECSNTANIYGKSYIGGICGYFSETGKSNNTSPDYNEIIKEIDKILNGDSIEGYASADKIKGKIIYCYNSGEINATDRAGGIVGLQSADALNKEFKLLYNYNLGIVEAGSYAGGIVGEALKSTIESCYNTGIITSTNAYAGGISGSSLGNIIACFNNASIKGKEHVGGISGYGAGLNNSYSIGLIYATDGYAGGLLGEAKEINDKIFDNYYISNGYSAFNNIDYKNKGMSTTREELASIGTLAIPLSFKYYAAGENELAYPRLKGILSYDGYLAQEFKDSLAKATSYSSSIIFVDEDGEIVHMARVGYNEDFDLANLPKVPYKEGYLVKWDPSFTGKAIKEDTIVKAVYVELIESIASSEGNAPLALLEGEFYPDTSFEIVKTDNNYLGSDTSLKLLGSYRININAPENKVNMDNLILSIRATSSSSTKIAVIKDGNVVIVPFEVNGDYLRFNLNGAAEFMVLEESFYNIHNEAFIKVASYTTLGIIVGLIVISGAAVVIYNNKRRASL